MLPPQTQKERNAQLYARIQVGDTYAAHRLVAENLALVNHCVSLFMRQRQRFQLDREDLFQEACFGLCEMLHKLLSPHRKRRSIEAAICSRIAHRLANWADSQSLFGPRRDKNQRLRREDWFDLFDEPQAVEIDNKTEPIAHGDGAAGNYVDSLDEALIDCKSKREVEAMRLASKGLSLREIGKALRVSHQTAMRLLDRIAARRTKRLMQADGLS